MKKFDQFLNENNNWTGLGIKPPEWPYEDNVRSYWMHILTEENRISEKDFTNYDKIKSYLDNFISEHNDTYKTIILEFEKKDSRYQFCAEHLNAIYPLDLTDIIEKCKPKIFTYTSYRLPNNEDLEDINNCNLSANKIIDGFSYTIIGRGMSSKGNKLKITQSIQMLCDKYPQNNTYKEALKEVKIKYNL